MELAEFSWGEGILLGNTQNFLADLRPEGLVGVVQEIDFQIGRGARNFYECGVYAVGRSAGHHAENEFCRRGHGIV